jgi:hypothetical protein
MPFMGSTTVLSPSDETPVGLCIFPLLGKVGSELGDCCHFKQMFTFPHKWELNKVSIITRVLSSV